MFNLISWNSCVKFPRASFALNVFSTSNVVDFLYVRSLLSIWIRFGHRIFAFFRSDNSLRKASCCLHLYFYIVSTSFLSFFTRFFPVYFVRAVCWLAGMLHKYCVWISLNLYMFSEREKKTLLNKLATEFFWFARRSNGGRDRDYWTTRKLFESNFRFTHERFKYLCYGSDENCQNAAIHTTFSPQCFFFPIFFFRFKICVPH